MEGKEKKGEKKKEEGKVQSDAFWLKRELELAAYLKSLWEFFNDNNKNTKD